MNQRTVQAYESAFNMYSQWCAREGIKALPADPIKVAKYIAWMGTPIAERKPVVYAASTVIKHHAAIKHFTTIGGHPDMTAKDGYALLQKVLTTAKAHLAQSKPKEALILQDLDKLCAVLTEGRTISVLSDLTKLRAGTAFFLLFVGGFRVNELVNIKWTDISWLKVKNQSEVYAQISVPHRKNDKRGQVVVVPQINKTWNPVRWLLRLKDVSEKTFYPTPVYVFNNTKEAEKGDATTHIGANTVRWWLKKWIKAIGLDEKKYSTHSGRRGGATALADAGATAEEIKAFGGWKSDVFKRYVQGASEAKLNAAAVLKFAAEGGPLDQNGKLKRGSGKAKVLTEEEEAELFVSESIDCLHEQLLEEFEMRA